MVSTSSLQRGVWFWTQCLLSFAVQEGLAYFTWDFGFGSSTHGPGNSDCGPLEHHAGEAQVGTFRLPTNCGNGQDYCNFLQCTFSLCSSGASAMTITVHYMHIEEAFGCHYDYLSIAGNKYCGVTAPGPIEVGVDANGCADVQFEADEMIRGHGFNLTFAGVYPVILPTTPPTTTTQSSQTSTQAATGDDFFGSTAGMAVTVSLSLAGLCVLVGLGFYCYTHTVRSSKVTPEAFDYYTNMYDPDVEVYELPPEVAYRGTHGISAITATWR